MTDTDDLLVFPDDQASSIPARARVAPWKILVVDDDDQVHQVSRMVLSGQMFEGRPMEFHSAHSGAEAKQLAQDHPDAALMMLDVVMETDNAGLDVVRHVRDVLGNRSLRIVLRTGQPGQAPEKSVVIDYDINDYKEKGELTAQRLVTTVVSALRAFRDIQTIECSRRGLMKVIAASRSLFEPQTLSRFAASVLAEITTLLDTGEQAGGHGSSGFAARRAPGLDSPFRIVAATGSYAATIGHDLDAVLPEPLRQRLFALLADQNTAVDRELYATVFRTSNGAENLICVEPGHPISELDLNLLDVFATNVAVAYDNVDLTEEIASTQTELIHTLSEVVETRSHETGRHVFRVGECSAMLARLAGLPQQEVELLRMVAPMHDLGKIGIPDAILNKLGKLTPDEFETMKAHTTIGHNILKNSNRPQFRSGAIVAHQHHEWWNGKGYPIGLEAEEIHIYGRVVAITDVFDALFHKRHYKAGWSDTQVRDYFLAQRGVQFDPTLVDLLIEHFDDFLAINRAFPD